MPLLVISSREGITAWLAGDDRPINPPPHHIEIAGKRYALGVSDPDRIDLVRLGWKDGSLI